MQHSRVNNQSAPLLLPAMPAAERDFDTLSKNSRVFTRQNSKQVVNEFLTRQQS